MSDSLKVKRFTEESMDIKCPDSPVPMSLDSVKFIIRMIISELDELACTVSPDEESKDSLMLEAFQTRDKCKYNYNASSPDELMAEQYDALVDSYYYSLNISAKHGANLSKIFDLVHQANLNKRDPETKKFIRRESDGKVMKPPGWRSPDIAKEIQRQREEGSWSELTPHV